MIRHLFSLIATIATVYTLLCFVRLVATWFPQYRYSAAVRFLSSVCDPYLNLFRGLTFLRQGGLDFTPAVALVVLMGASSISQTIALQNAIRIGLILADLLSILWSVASSLLTVLVLLIGIRLVALLIAPHSTFALWQTLDRSLSPFLYRITGKFALSRPSWTKVLIISLIAALLLNLLGRSIIGLIAGLLASLPF